MDNTNPHCCRDQELAAIVGLCYPTKDSHVSACWPLSETEGERQQWITVLSPYKMNRCYPVQVLTSCPFEMSLSHIEAGFSLPPFETCGLCSCQVVCQCCKESDSSSAVEKLMSGVEEGLISEGALLRLVRTVQQKAPSSFPMTLVSLLDELEKNTQEPDGHQTEGKTGRDHLVWKYWFNC